MIYPDITSILRDTLGGLYPVREFESLGRLIAENVTGRTWIQLQTNRNQPLTPDQENKVHAIIDRLKTHEPIQYILGETEFYGLRLKVRPGVLIPRGETEELVEWILESKGHLGIRAFGHKGLRILDIGCGCGAIAIALAKNLPGAEVIAADISENALAITEENAKQNQVNLLISFFDVLKPSCPYALKPLCPFDLIVSNPPYIPKSEKSAMSSHVVGYEPKAALFVPNDDPRQAGGQNSKFVPPLFQHS
jgi:release factor glutamine methyltransferase